MPETKISTAIASNEAVKSLIDRGLVPPNARRIILDFEAGKAVRILYECFVEKQTVDAILDIDFGAIES